MMSMQSLKINGAVESKSHLLLRKEDSLRKDDENCYLGSRKISTPS